MDFLKHSTPVMVVNDAHAALLGEAWVRAAQPQRDVLRLSSGTGIGSAIMMDGRLLKGHIGRAGHSRHIGINSSLPPDDWGIPRGLETAISKVFIKQLKHPQFQSTKDLVDGYKSGNEEATSLWIESIRKFAVGATSMINAVDSEELIIGGGGAKAGEALLAP